MSNFFKFSKERSFLTNLILCIISLASLILFPTLIMILLGNVIKSGPILTTVSNLLLLCFLYLLYFKDLNSEAKIYGKNFKKNIVVGLKYWGIGLGCMIVVNLFIMILLKNISANEAEVREILKSNTLLALLSISIFAPIIEEIMFRKSIRPLVNNKIIYALICGLLFGGAHILTNIQSGSFVLTDLIYILPYGCLGSAFALMDYETNTTFTSIVMHATHNTLAALLLLKMFSGGMA